MIYQKQKNYGAAIIAFEQSIEMNASLKFAYEEIANTYKEQEQYDSALAYYKRAQNLDRELKGEMYGGLMDYKMATIYALQENENSMYLALKNAKNAKVFKDKKVYQAFLQEKAFRKYRSQKDFKKFAKSIRGSKKYNKFTSAELSWFRMSM
ncbi:MAG: tetratricopeptide (TPR) repeat protein [Saprospiraceae bacterium]|jgi:tetratricopeptide (TPR) repeat protein